MLSDLDFNIVPQSYYKLKSVKEEKVSFLENSILKARYASKMTGLPALSDDSGLVIPSLKNEPGLYSSRYSKSGIENISKLLLFMNDSKIKYVNAFYYCAIALVFFEMDPIPVISTGKLEGHIINKRKGKNGFGYDSCFFLKKYGLTMAELDTVKKNKISHRAKAVYKLKKKYKHLFN